MAQPTPHTNPRQAGHARRFNRMMVAVLLLAVALVVTSVARSQSEGAYVFKVRRIPTGALGISNPAGLAYSPAAAALLSVGPANPAAAATDLSAISLFTENLVATSTLPISITAPESMVYDAATSSLYFLDQNGQALVQVAGGPDGLFATPGISRFDLAPLGLKRAQDIAVQGDELVVLDAEDAALVAVGRDAANGFDAQTAVANGRVRRIPLDAQRIGQPRSIALDPASGQLHVLDAAGRRVYRLTADGAIESFIATDDLGLADPTSLAFAPSGDPTDDPAETSLYVADSGQGQSGGQIVELSLVAAAAAPAATSTASLLSVIDTSQWSPPSPDPAGIAYDIASGKLVVSDSEVNEMSIQDPFVGNVFDTTTGGTLLGVASTLAFSREPTGIAVNHDNGHLLIADDDDQVVYDIDRGPDGTLGTGDDVVSAIDTAAFNCFDPESVSYGAGKLYIADGIGQEVYIVSPGGNGVFDGVPPGGDDTVTHFDTESIGLRDPEGVDYNFDTGTLFVASRADSFVVETTLEGAVVGSIDISAANAMNPSDIAYAPGSANPGVMSLYVTDRAVDNWDDPNENDGRIFELSYGTASTIPTPSPTATLPPPTAGPSPTPTNTPAPTAIPTEATLAPVADAWVNESSPDANYGADTALVIDGSPYRAAFFKFDLSGYAPGAIQSATLRLMVTDATSAWQDVWLVEDDGWTESGITYNNRPAYSNMIATFPGGSAGTWVEIDLTAAAASQAGDAFSFTINSTSTYRFDVASREASGQEPELIVVASSTPADTPTPTPTDAPPAPTNTPTPTPPDEPPAPTATFTPTSTPTDTPTPTATFTPAPTDETPAPTATFTPTPTDTPPAPTATFTPTSTPTDAPPTPTATFTPTPTDEPSSTPVPQNATLYPVADAWVYDGKPTTNYGADPALVIDGTPYKSAYLMFDLGGYVPGSIQSATLRLKVTDATSAQQDVWLVEDTSWTEDGITYNNRPARAAAPFTSFPGGANGTWVEVDVTGAAAGRAGGLFALNIDMTSTYRFDVKSREAATEWPELVIVASSGSENTPVPTSTPIPTSTATPTNTVTPTSTPGPTPTDAPPTATPTATLTPTPTSTPTPTVVPSPTPVPSIVTLQPVADTFAAESSPNTNYGTDDELQVDGSPLKVSYLKFDLGGVSAVQSAVLRLYVTDNSNSPQDVWLVNDTSWVESSLTWGNRPPPSSLIASFLGGSRGVWVEVDITSAAANQAGGLLALAIDSSGKNGLDVSSREASSGQPELVIEMNDGNAGGEASSTLLADTQSLGSRVGDALNGLWQSVQGLLAPDESTP